MKSWHGGVLLQRGIADEIAYRDFIFNDEDYRLLQTMIAEINALGYDVHYLAEIEEFRLPKSGEIIKKYINEYISEATRAYLIPQMVIDKVDDCAKLVLDLYLHFKDSDEYISKPEKPAPAHIYVRYDNAFKRLKPKRLKNQLIKLVSNPRDAFYLPFTVRMLASWKQEDIKYILMSYLDGSSITAGSIGLYDDENRPFYPSLAFVIRELKFTAIDGLKYYPSIEIIELIKQYTIDSDLDVRTAAKRTMRVLEKAIAET